jgi:hypothetical protein
MRKRTFFRLLSLLILPALVETAIPRPSWALCCRCLYQSCDNGLNTCLAGATTQADQDQCYLNHGYCLDNVDSYCS